MRSTYALLLACLSLSACYSPAIPNGAQECSKGGGCSAGYFCGPDNHCYKMGARLPDLGIPPDLTAACTADSCKAMNKVCDVTGLCVDCLTDDNCPAGKLCSMKVCVPGCNGMHPCPDGMCVNGMCKKCGSDADCGGATPRCDVPSGKCVECLVMNDNCQQGFFCNPSTLTCGQGCADDSKCPAGDGGAQQPKCCNHICVETLTDNGNCGGCGTACGNQTCCTGFCSDTTSDLTNCGGCGLSCTGGNATWSCTASKCVPMCKPGFGDCNGNPADGCETNLTMDPNNCTACGMKCMGANANMTCNNMCVLASCKMGFANCNNQVGDGCEVGIDGDVNNCGACGNVCNLAHASAACVGGKCAIAACNMGFANCDGNAANGCETAVLTDPNNCGNCGVKCGGLPNVASVTCTNAMCTIGACAAGFRDCNGVAGDGCEVNPTNDVNNCGNCGVKCAAGANVTGVACQASACVITGCAAPFLNCNGVFNDGCEANRTNDVKNCGACNVACAQNQQCVNSMCSNGCLANGMNPPASCATGVDPETMSPWIVCTADCNVAWMSANTGGNYHIVQICNLLGYTKIGMWGGTCGNVCGYCEAATSCMARGAQTFDNGTNAPNCGSDANGGIYCNTVMWQCLR